MDLTIAIVSWNTRDILDQCLESIRANRQGLECEVIVVDNNSSDGSQEMVQEKHRWVRLITNAENTGFSRANNQAYQVCEGRYFLLLNPDTICRKNTLQAMVQFLDEHPGAGAVGPLVLNADETLQLSWARFPTLLSEMQGRINRTIDGMSELLADADGVRVNGAFQTDWVGGCCLMTRRETVEHIGLLDENLYMYSEETDWCLRMKQGGWEIWVEPKAEIVHLGAQSSSKIKEECARILRRSKCAYFAKHFNLTTAAVLAVVLGVKSFGKRVLTRATRM
ncbi:MAG: glycosyltransferase family 2 protein [Armatimonadota bacterium]|nr:glycosyltransferase family 2 protein [bacterium]